MSSSQKSTNLLAETMAKAEAIKKHSVLLEDSDSEEADRSYIKETAEIEVEFFEPFHNKFTKKSEGERFQLLKIFREDSNMQLMAKAVFDFSMEDNDRFKLLFETGSNLKRMWQFIFLSFMDQELMMLELRYKQYAEDFNRINAFQTEKNLIAKKDGPKVYRLFKLFCLKDRVFNSLVKREKKVKPTSTEVMVNTPAPIAMEVENGLKLPVYSTVTQKY